MSNVIDDTAKNRAAMHLTVDKDGTVSLWDSEELARKITDECYLKLILVGWQINRIQEAQEVAQGKRPAISL